MTTNFPTSLDTFTNPTSADPLGSSTPKHSLQHSNLNDAVLALETKVGINSSAVTSSLDYKVALAIKKDGTTTTTGIIPFALGLSSAGPVSISAFSPSFSFAALSGETLSWSAAGGQITQTFSNGVVDPDYLTWVSGLLSFSSVLCGVQLKSTVATGTAPIIAASTTKVTNLNADLLDGKDTGTSGNVIGLLDGNNTISGANSYSGVQTFLDTKFALRNSGNTFSSTLVTAASAARTVTVPDATFTIPATTIAQTWSVAQLFNDTMLTLRNTANTFTGTFSCAITAARTWTMPNATTTLVGSSQSVTWTSGTATWSTTSLASLTLTATSPSTQSYAIRNNGGAFEINDVTGGTSILKVDPSGSAGDPIFGFVNGVTFAIAGNSKIAFQATTFFFTDTSGGTFRFDFGTTGSFAFYIGSTIEYTSTAGALTFKDGYTIKSGTTTGLKIGDSTSQKIGIHNATPSVQRAGAAQTAVATTASTNVAPYGFTTQAQADAVVTLQNELRAALVEKGIIKGSA